MKKLAVVLAVLLIFSITASAENGASEIKPVFYAGGGLSMPLSPSNFSDYWKMGIGFGGGVGIQVTPYLELVGKFFYNSFPLNEDDYLPALDASYPAYDLSDATLDGGTTKAMEFGADVKYLFTVGPESPFAPFFVAGLGMANMSTSDLTVTDDEITIERTTGTDTKFALSGGGGFDYMFSPKAGLWVEVRYVTVFTEGDATGFLPIRAGVKILFGE